jgi:hypothetical protein
MPAPYSTLQQIYTKVRRLVRAPSANQLSDDDINNYVNTFLLYDLPEALRLFNLRKTFTFYTTPYVDTYPLGGTDETLNPDNQFYNFKNKYITIHPPLYIAGFQRFYTQSREQFFGMYPQIQSITTSVLGDGFQTRFTGNLPSNSTVPNSTILRGSVLFNSIDVNYNGIAMYDVPIVDPIGFPEFGQLVPINTPVGVFDPDNFVNYITGQYVVTFPVAPFAGQQVFAQCVPTVIAMPQAMLEFDDVLTLRPVPDQVYKVNFEVYVQPIELLSTNLAQEPELQQWAQYIAYGASRKVFQDRMDMESLQMIEPEFRQQERFVMRRTIVQLTNQRVATLFTEGNANWPYSGWGYFGNNQ